MTTKNIVCIGGGHGLGRLLKSLSINPNYNVTAVVSTTDNGGSTGRLRRQYNTIAWGDIRYCMNQLVSNTSFESLLFDLRFNNAGELSNHAMGNLMLYAADQLCLRPTDTVELMRRMLNIKTQILPMSDINANLTAMNSEGEMLYGELEIDTTELELDYESLGLTNQAVASKEVLQAINAADLIVMAPGSFVTSILPPLLMNDLVDAVNTSNAQLVMFANLAPEEHSHFAKFEQKVAYFEHLGLKPLDHVFWPTHREAPEGMESELTYYPFSDGLTNQHDPKVVYMAIEEVLNRKTKAVA